jgi:hypothetical protein
MTPIDPPPGLLDKLAEAIEDGLFRMHGITSSCDHRSEAELVWDAVAEGLGLREALIFGGRRHLVSDPLEPQP